MWKELQLGVWLMMLSNSTGPLEQDSDDGEPPKPPSTTETLRPSLQTCRGESVHLYYVVKGHHGHIQWFVQSYWGLQNPCANCIHKAKGSNQALLTDYSMQSRQNY